ncbi:unnamed protein product [Notodromas monacha]|uniref:Polyprenal reductase n=1 Tax=Notodromas monacha TaxID=399045 RepID=A0A7R9BJQ4_9CRUS|nr:unnamed protein product [Notodromas monacha]CAG0916719.1 unnamed protein product [Notodromas monacha]
MLEWLVCAAFLLMGSTIFLGWGLLEICPKERAGLKHFAESILLWGKLSNGKRASKFNVPKRWFAHFYVTGLLVSSTALGMTVFGRQTLTRALFSLPPFGPGSGSCSAAVGDYGGWRPQRNGGISVFLFRRFSVSCLVFFGATGTGTGAGSRVNGMLGWARIGKTYSVRTYGGWRPQRNGGISVFLFRRFSVSCLVFFGATGTGTGAGSRVNGMLGWARIGKTYSVQPWRIQLALALLTIQTSRRLYECVFVSVFSAQRMEWFDYVVGH